MSLAIYSINQSIPDFVFYVLQLIAQNNMLQNKMYVCNDFSVYATCERHKFCKATFADGITLCVRRQ